MMLQWKVDATDDPVLGLNGIIAVSAWGDWSHVDVIVRKVVEELASVEGIVRMDRSRDPELTDPARLQGKDCGGQRHVIHDVSGRASSFRIHGM